MKPEEIRDKLVALVGPVEYSAGPVDAAVTVPADKWHQAAEALRREASLGFDFLRSLCGVDRPAIGKIEIVAHVFSYAHKHAIVVKTQVDRNAPSLATVSDVWPAADWHEREAFDMFGVEFAGHPDLRRILLPEDWEGFPLRKDYQPPASYHGIPNKRPDPSEAQ